MKDDKRVAVVTGGSRGIGAAVARELAEAGYIVCLTYHTRSGDAQDVADTITKRGGSAHTLRTDVSSAEDVDQLFAFADRLGPLRVLVNNAGITGKISMLADAEVSQIRRVIDTNVTGLIMCSRHAVKRMSTATGGGGGTIINLSSAAATIGSPEEYVWYAASKGAVDSFTLGLSKEIAAQGIRVNAVSPGLIDTEIHAASGDAARTERLQPLIPMKRIGRAQEVAKVIRWLASEDSSYATGANVRVAGGR
jgi:NAD(P)-dependent dehydrogenase (short-subunit alcohol dehydrogenase family)